MLRLYDFLDSGNGYKVRLLLHQLDLPFALISKDIDRGETRTAEFLKINPNGRVPVLELEDGRRLAESNAILSYLAEGSRFLPDGRFQRAQVFQWMFFEQYSHEPNIATPRYWIKHGRATPDRREVLEQKRILGHAALNLMNDHLSGREFLVADRYTIADICLFAYTHVAGEGGFDLSAYPAVLAWLVRVAAQPKHIPITQRWFGAGADPSQ